MTTILLAIGLLTTTSYSYQEIEPPPETGTLGKVVLTEKGLVAGYWYNHVPPGHGGATLATPFVFQGGKTIALPTGDGEHGHVLAGNDTMLVGDVDSTTGKGWLPAIWTPDPVKGWAKAHLRVPTDDPGRIRWLSADGTAWIVRSGEIVRWKGSSRVNEPFKVTKFDFLAATASGELFGTRYSAVGFGPSRMDERAGYYKAEVWHELIPSQTSYVQDVSLGGAVLIEVSTPKPRSMLYRRGKLQELPLESEGGAIGISRSGDVAGYTQTTNGDRRACLWIDGTRFDISRAIKGLTLESANAVNDRGLILAGASKEGWAQDRLFLLTPRS
jgi:probable HAF family extracellular repeat protein